tara:strand:+ start:1892 stop:2530 length:639 start_codon:yes stop_codon:yes gene_type:complete
MHFLKFKKIISKLNHFELPGKKSFLELSPPERVKQIIDGCIPNNSVKAAVTLLFYGDYKNQTRLVLILRNKYDGVHSNQVAFPGGKKETGDLDLKETAVRETIEELGLLKKNIVIQKELTEIYIPPSNCTVKPYLCFYEKHPKFKPSSDEVASIYNPLLEDLLDLNITKSQILIEDQTKIVPSFKIENKIVWGATAMIINEFVSLFKEVINS